MNWLKNAWYVAGFVDELDGVDFIARRLLDIPVVMLRTSAGRVAALEDLCPHRLMPLSVGRRVGDDLRCGYHGLRFSIAGDCVDAPGHLVRPDAACVRTFPLVVRHGLLWIWPGERSRADEALIPDVHWNDDQSWAASRGYHHLEADFRLAVDNLLDLSHETYVHQKTIGNEDEESIASFPAKVSVEGDCLIRAHREMPNIVAPPFFAMVLNHQGRINRWQTAISLAPCLNMTDFGVYPVGTAKDKAYRSHVLHLLTPETERTTHYFWSLTRNYRVADAGLTEGIRKAIVATFDEDKALLAIQQKQLLVHGDHVPRVALKLDEAPMRARQLLSSLIRRESEASNFVLHPVSMVGEETPELSMM